MSRLIPPCEWQTASSAASTAITDRVATACVAAFGRTCTSIHRLISRTIAVRRAIANLAFLDQVNRMAFRSTRMHRVSKSFQSLVLGWVLLVGGPLVQSLSAQDGKRSGDAPPISAHQRSRSSGNIPAITGRLARSVVPDRAVHPTSRSSRFNWGPSLLAATKKHLAYFISFRPCRFRVLTVLVSRRE